MPAERRERVAFSHNTVMFFIRNRERFRDIGETDHPQSNCRYRLDEWAVYSRMNETYSEGYYHQPAYDSSRHRLPIQTLRVKSTR